MKNQKMLGGFAERRSLKRPRMAFASNLCHYRGGDAQNN